MVFRQTMAATLFVNQKHNLSDAYALMLMLEITKIHARNCAECYTKQVNFDLDGGEHMQPLVAQ
jgi:hypothetical protein